MDVHVPKWALWGVGVLMVAGAIAAAFFIGQGSGDDDSTAATEAAAATSADTAPTETTGDGQTVPGDEAATTVEEPTVEPAKCSEAEAKRATISTGWADTIKATMDVQGQLSGVDFSSPDLPTHAFFDEVAGFRPSLVECRDLNGDGVDEMTFAVNSGAAGRTFNWAVFASDENGEWELAFSREGHLISSLKVRGDTVVERSPTYREGEPSCCPSGSTTNEIAYEDGAYEVVSPTSSRADRLIEASTDGVTRFGPLDPLQDNSVHAIAELGTPSSIARISDAVCDVAWSDLGLLIHFVNLGGANPCGPDGRVGSIDLLGSPAEQAGWQTTEGAQVGMSASELRELYPEAKPGKNGRALALVEKVSPFGEEGELTPVLTAYLADGKAIAFQLAVGAGGE